MEVRTNYLDRRDAGRELAKALARYKGTDCVVFGLPRGGAVTAAVVADELRAPLGLVIVRKLSHPAHPEYAIGAVTDENEVVYNESALEGVSEEFREEETQRRLEEANLRRKIYLSGTPPPDVRMKTAIIVDDGVATGSSMRAAAQAIHTRGPRRVVLAAPVGPLGIVEKLADCADEVVVPWTPEGFFAIGQFYVDFEQVTNENVAELMRKHLQAKEPNPH